MLGPALPGMCAQINKFLTVYVLRNIFDNHWDNQAAFCYFISSEGHLFSESMSCDVFPSSLPQLEIKPRALHIVGKCIATELQPQPVFPFDEYN
jgi:hypothetical protein